MLSVTLLQSWIASLLQIMLLKAGRRIKLLSWAVLQIKLLLWAALQIILLKAGRRIQLPSWAVLQIKLLLWAVLLIKFRLWAALQIKLLLWGVLQIQLLLRVVLRIATISRLTSPLNVQRREHHPGVPGAEVGRIANLRAGRLSGTALGAGSHDRLDLRWSLRDTVARLELIPHLRNDLPLTVASKLRRMKLSDLRASTLDSVRPHRRRSLT